MATLHSTLTDPNLHETKGVASAGTNKIYVSDGAGSGAWTELPSTSPDLLITRIGSIVKWPITSAPSKWMLCYGQEIDRTTYANLFGVIGTTYGAGDGLTTFNLPDCRGRLVASIDTDTTGTSANRLTNAYTNGINGDLLAATGGSDTHTLVQTGEIPFLSGTAASSGSHTHTVTNGSNVWRDSGSNNATGGGSSTVTGYTLSAVPAGDHSHDVTANSGGGNPHTNIQPTMVVNMIIYHGVV